MSNKIREFYKEDTITIGLIDSIITISRVLKNRKKDTLTVKQALADLEFNSDFNDIINTSKIITIICKIKKKYYNKEDKLYHIKSLYNNDIITTPNKILKLEYKMSSITNKKEFFKQIKIINFY